MHSIISVNSQLITITYQSMSHFLDILQNYTALSYFHNCLNYL